MKLACLTVVGCHGVRRLARTLWCIAFHRRYWVWGEWCAKHLIYGPACDKHCLCRLACTRCGRRFWW